MKKYIDNCLSGGEYSVTAINYQQEFLECEEKYRQLFETMSLGVIYQGADGKIISANPAAEKILGLTFEALQNKTSLDPAWQSLAEDGSVVPGDKHPSMIALSSGKPVGPFIMGIYNPQKQDHVWLSINAVPLFQPDEKKPFQVYTTFEDVTERKLAVEALRESESFVKSVMDNLPIGIATNSIDPEVKFEYMNDNFVKFYRTTREALSKIDGFWEAVYEDPEFRAQLKEKVVKDCNSGDPKQMSWDNIPIVREGKEPYYISAKNIPVPGKPLMISTVQDVTSLVKAEESLRKHLRELEALNVVSTTLRQAETIDKMVEILLDETLKALDLTDGAICLHDQDEDELFMAARRGWLAKLKVVRSKSNTGIAGTVFTTGEHYITADIAVDPQLNPELLSLIPSGLTGVYWPINKGLNTVGVFVLSAKYPRQLTNEELKLLASLAEMAGTAIHRLSLHEDTVTQLQQLQSMRSIDKTISSSLDLKLTMNILLEHVVTQPHVGGAAIFLLHPHLKQLEYAVSRGIDPKHRGKETLKLGGSATGKAVLERRMIIVPDTSDRVDQTYTKLLNSTDYKGYINLPLIARGDVKGVLVVFHNLTSKPEKDWLEFLEILAGQASIAIDSASLFEGLQKSNLELTVAYDATIEGWAYALDLRDEETEGHSERVTELTILIARHMGFKEDELIHVKRGALLHDIGKMGIPDNILLKPGPLTNAEWRIMRRHPWLAYKMLLPIDYLRPALDIPYCHHEKWDGTGYPRRLKGERIPLVARIFAVVDVYDALTSDRPYRKAWSKEKTLALIKEDSGKHFDPEVVKVFLQTLIR